MRTDAVAAAVKGDGWMVCGACDDGRVQVADGGDVWSPEADDYVTREYRWDDCPTCLGHGRIRVHYVGRTMPGVKGSALGNPFKPGRDGTVTACLRRYEVLLRGGYEIVDGGWECDGAMFKRELGPDAIAALDAIVADLKAGYAVGLCCWCCSGTVEECRGKCHAVVVADVIRGRMTND